MGLHEEHTDVQASSSSNNSLAKDEIEKAPPYSDEKIGSIATVEDPEGETLPGAHLKHVSTLGKLRFRPDDDTDPTDWWFASTAIPLIAATFSPMANVLSIAALVTPWRASYTDGCTGPTCMDIAISYPDPPWGIACNVASLVCGFIGNLFLLFNFTRKIRYIVALPTTIVLFFIASGILTGITSAVHIHVPPGPNDTYTQGFWHAIIAAVLYQFNALILMVNMFGYFLGHYPQHFTLTDEQRNLILQTMMFFIWLAGGGAVFAAVCGWSYVNALYFCDVTILTVGFGDYSAPNDTGRGLVFPFSVGGIVILGLMVSSIHKFAGELSKDKVIRNHMENARVHTLSRIATTDIDIEKAQKQALEEEPKPSQFLKSTTRSNTMRNTLKIITAPVMTLQRVRTRKDKLIIMREEKDRFDAIRKIQKGASEFKKWYALTLSVIAFGLLWCVGAVVFWQAEKNVQGLTYFEALYFCYVSLLTIGYGDLSPKSNAGKPFFIVWSLVAVPTMTILISDMGDTVIASFKRGTFKLADWTVLPKDGLMKEVMEVTPWLWGMMHRRAVKKKIRKGMPVGDDGHVPKPTLEDLATEDLTDAELTRQLAFAIRRTADDLKNNSTRTYSYEEWVEYTRLIRFTKTSADDVEQNEAEEGVVEWDWLDENSPMLSNQSEVEWVLDRLCESLLRSFKKNKLLDSNGKSYTTPTTSEPATAVELDQKHDDPYHGTRFSAVNFSPHLRDEVEHIDHQRASSTGNYGGVDPRHRGIGLFPELGRGDRDHTRTSQDSRRSTEIRPAPAPHSATTISPRTPTIHFQDPVCPLPQTAKTTPTPHPTPRLDAAAETAASDTDTDWKTRRRRASGADGLLTFFTGPREGEHKYARDEPHWSDRAIKRIEERRRSSVSEGGGLDEGVETLIAAYKRRGPFARAEVKSGGVGGGRGGAGTRSRAKSVAQ